MLDIATADLTIDGILAKGAELVLRKGIKYYVIGPYNCLEGGRESWQTEGEYVSILYQKMTRFAIRHKVHVFFVAHTTKVPKDKKTGQYEVPTMYMIAGSANFFNKTHNGICIYRNYSDDTTDVYVQKVKFFYNGKIGWTSFKFDPQTGRYQEPGLEYESETSRRIEPLLPLNLEPPEPPKSLSLPVVPDLSNWKAPLPIEELTF